MITAVVEDVAEEKEEVVDAAVVRVDEKVDATRIVGANSRATTADM